MLKLAERLSDSERARLEELARDLDECAERGVDLRELRAERFGAPTIVTETRCGLCDGLLTKTSAGWWVHMGPTRCTRAVPLVCEAKR